MIDGGVSKIGNVLFNPIREYVEKYTLNPTGQKTEIIQAEIDQDTGVIGAAVL